MRTLQRPRKQTWLFISNLMLATLFGFIAFIAIDFVSAGVFTSIATISAVFMIIALVHYFLWGREVPIPKPPSVQVVEPPIEPADLITIEIDEPERAEMMQVLQQSLASSGGAVQPLPTQRADLRRQLLQKLRMFGA